MSYTSTIFLMLLALLSISSSPIVARLIDLPAVTISFWRMAFAGFFLWSYSGLKSNKKNKLKKSSIRKTIIAGILLGIHFAFFYTAVKLTTIANATILGTLAPFFTLIMEIIVLKRKYKKIIYLGLILSIIGSIIIMFDDVSFSSQHSLGNLCALICSICLSISFMIAEDVRKTEGTVQFTRLLYSIAAITIVIISFITLDNLNINSSYSFLGLVYLGLVPTLLGHNMFYYSLKYITPTIVATIPLGEPVIASIIASYIFLEVITLNTILGGSFCIIGIGIILVNKIDK